MKIEQVSFKYNQEYHYTGQFDKESKLLILCFFQTNKNNVEKIFQDMQATFPYASIVGCSGAGEIKEDFILDDEIVVSYLKFDSRNAFHVFSTDLESQSSLQAGITFSNNLSSINNPTGILFLSDGLHLNGDDFSTGLKEHLKSSLPIIGGMAGDGDQFKETLILINGKIQHKKIAMIVFAENVRLSVATNAGWTRFGFEHVITKSSNNIVYEIDGTPALDFYKLHLGKEAEFLPASGLHFPLQLLEENDADSKGIARTLLGIDNEAKSLIFAGQLPVNSKVDILKSTHSQLIDASVDNIKLLKEKINENDLKGNILSLIISCVGRRLTLGQSTEEELGGYKELKQKTFQTGFYSYGELTSSAKSLCDLHNQTLTQALIWEENE